MLDTIRFMILRSESCTIVLHCRVYWERMIGLNRHWQSVNWRDGEKPLVAHFAGCSFCNPPTDKITEKQVSSFLLRFTSTHTFALPTYSIACA